MAITCPRCGKGYDVTLFEFGHGVWCTCGAWVDLETGNRRAASEEAGEGPGDEPGVGEGDEPEDELE